MGYLRPRTGQVTLDGTGAGTVELAIDNTNQRWLVDYVTVQTNQAAGATPVPRCLTYQNVVSQQGFIGGTNNGAMDTAQGRIVMYPDDVVKFVWSGGIPGSVATATISGTFVPAGVPLRD